MARARWPENVSLFHCLAQWLFALIPQFPRTPQGSVCGSVLAHKPRHIAQSILLFVGLVGQIRAWLYLYQINE